MTNLKNASVEEVLNWLKVKVNRKRFYKEWYKHWGWRHIRTYENGSIVLLNIRGTFRDNPEKGCELAQIYKTLVAIGLIGSTTKNHGDTMGILGEVYIKYRERFTQKYLLPKVKKNGGFFPHEQKTNAIQELLARGWVHEDDHDIDKTNKCWLVCNIAPLVYPKEFELHQDAIIYNGKFGIPGYTGTKLPLNK